MRNSFDEVTEHISEIQENLTQAVNTAKEVLPYISELLNQKTDLEQQINELRRNNSELKGQVSTLENKLSEQRTEFEKKLETSENRIISLQRELDLGRDDYKKLEDRLREKDERIKVLESQKQELTDSLRQQSL
ncbi:MAG: hypothetical protein JSV04_09650 [Candidatus Heimdallarchaeota archaeon]|nr:MAG: hypothetical protein JSV04_09650 [Candidatus Heimdallarchaeota archaeon]